MITHIQNCYLFIYFHKDIQICIQCKRENAFVIAHINVSVMRKILLYFFSLFLIITIYFTFNKCAT